jgi:pre-mRNA-splicing factor SYF2
LSRSCHVTDASADPNSAAERAYRRKVQGLKPDLASYSATRSGSSSSSSSSALVRSNAGTSSQIVRREDLDVNDGKLSYGGHKPDEAAVDRVISNLNLECVTLPLPHLAPLTPLCRASLRGKRSRKRDEDPDAEVNYINDRNKHFNAKVKRVSSRPHVVSVSPLTHARSSTTTRRARSARISREARREWPASMLHRTR